MRIVGPALWMLNFWLALIGGCFGLFPTDIGPGDHEASFYDAVGLMVLALILASVNYWMAGAYEERWSGRKAFLLINNLGFIVLAFMVRDGAYGSITALPIIATMGLIAAKRPDHREIEPAVLRCYSKAMAVVGVLLLSLALATAPALIAVRKMERLDIRELLLPVAFFVSEYRVAFFLPGLLLLALGMYYRPSSTTRPDGRNSSAAV